MARVIDARRNRLLLAVLIVTHLLVISQQVDGGGGASLLQRMVFAMLSPLQRGVASALRGAGSLWSGYIALRGARSENLRLAQQVRDLETQLQQAGTQAAQVEKLRELLELKTLLPLDTVAAEVVARDGVPWFHTLTLNRGLEAGIGLNAAVLSPNGVVGRVIAVGPRAARVQLILDRNSGVGALLERTRATGIVSGDATGRSGLLNMAYVSSLAEVTEGDRVLTSGLDRIYPKGLVIGTVEAVGAPAGLFRDEVRVMPSARFDQLESVLVVRRAPETPTLTESVR